MSRCEPTNGEARYVGVGWELFLKDRWWKLEELPPETLPYAFAYLSRAAKEAELKRYTHDANRLAKLGLYTQARRLSVVADALEEHLK